MRQGTICCVYCYTPIYSALHKRCLIYKCRTNKLIKHVCLSAQDTIPKYLKDHWHDIRQGDQDCERSLDYDTREIKYLYYMNCGQG